MAHGSSIRWQHAASTLMAFGFAGIVACAGAADRPARGARDSALAGAAAPAQDTQELRPPWNIDRPVTSGLILIDRSMSVKGYDGSPTSEFRKLLNTLETEALVEGVNTFQIASFSDAVLPPGPSLGFTEVLSTQFDGQTTCLAAPWQLQASGFRFIFTDGVPSAGPGGSPPLCSCPGADPTNVNCIARAIVDYAAQGNGVWVLAIRANFAGPYFPEFPPRRPFSPPRPVKRPLYAWIGGPHLDQGRRMVSRAAATLSQQFGGDQVIALEIWPGKWSGRRPAPVTSASIRLIDGADTPRCGADRSRLQLARVEGQTLTLRPSQRAAQPLIPLRVPFTTMGNDLPGPIVPLLEVTAGKNVDVTGGRIIWWTNDSTGGCFELPAGTTAVWSTQGTVAARANPLAAWSTHNDAVVADLDKTLLQAELWQTTVQLLSAPGRTVRFSFLRAVVQ